MPFFSIIIPTFNRSNYLITTILSVQKQSFLDWECIVVDDGSTDDTKKIVEEICRHDKRVKYIYQKNAERSAARNNGIHHAIGEYICFLDSDDRFLENHLESLMNNITLKNNPEALFFTNYILLENGNLISQNIPSLEKDVIKYLFFNPIIPARVCIHKTILEIEKFDEDIVIVEDLLLWVKIAQNFPIFHIEIETIIYNLHDENSVNIKNKSAQKRLDGLLLFKRKYRSIQAKIPSNIWNGVVGETHFGLMKFYLFNNERLLALEHLVISIVYQKLHPQLKHKLLMIYKITFFRPIPEYINFHSKIMKKLMNP